MAVSRYELVRRLAEGRRVLEVACGSGQGLGYVARSAARIVGGDITLSLVARARTHYQGRVPVLQFDAHALPFAEAAFDLIEIHEALYYMARLDQVFAECKRVLAPGGLLVVSSINPAWPDFNPSPHAVRFLEAPELEAALLRWFPSVSIRFGFAVRPGGVTQRGLSVLKRLAVRLGIIPKSMRGKTVLKRIFLGRLVPVPAELTSEYARIDEAVTAPFGDADTFRVMYAVARR
jgi:ubiquinone/menaquinone biosynthesis C-methylase UbiE